MAQPSDAGAIDAGVPDAAIVESLDHCFDDLTAPLAGSFIDVQTYATSDGRYRIRRARRPGDRVSVGETFPYDLVRFGVETKAGVLCVSSVLALSYDFGHHNWDDVMTARTPSTTYEIHERASTVSSVGLAWMDTLTIFGSVDRSVEGPLPLTEAGCHTLPFNLNGCPGRTRTDR